MLENFKEIYDDEIENDDNLFRRRILNESDIRMFVYEVCKRVASQPVVEADAEKPCGTNYDCHYRKAIIHDSRCPKFRAYIQSPGNL